MSGKQTIVLVLISLGLIACRGTGSGDANASFEPPLSNETGIHSDGAADGHDHPHVAETEATAEVQVVVVPSELVVGPNRFAVGLLDPSGATIHDATVHFHYFDLREDSPRLESERDARRVRTPDGLATIFADERVFDYAGDWGVEVQVRFPDGTAAVNRVRFPVLESSAGTAPGEQAPRVHTPTAADVAGDLSRLTSAEAPNPAFYNLSLDEALANGRPTVLLFATPAFCQTRFCGPDYEIVGGLQRRYGDAVNFIHVEVYSGLPDPAANNWELTPAVEAFGLTTEPWLFLVDRTGTVVYRVEGLFTEAEVDEHLRPLVEAG